MTERSTSFEVRRPLPTDWPGVLKVLRTANFHRVGSSEMPSFPLSDCYIATADGVVVGVGGYRILDATTAKTTLLAVDPAWRGAGVGARLQEARLETMKRAGAKVIYTNTDDETVIDWLIRRYGFRRTGDIIPKTCSFGKPEVDHWVTLALDV